MKYLPKPVRRSPQTTAMVAYGLAVAITVAALLLRLALAPIWGTSVPFILFFPAILVTGWLGGLGPGLVATALATLGSWYFLIEPLNSWAIASPSEALSLGVFGLVGVVISGVNEAWRRQTERARSAEERFRLAIEAAPTAMIMVDDRGFILMANALTERVLGYGRDEIVGQPIERFVPPRFRARHPGHRASFLADAHQRPMGVGLDLYALRKDGSEIPVEIGLSPISTSAGTVVLAAVTDITERKRIEHERAQLLEREQAARGEIERASRLKDEFLAALSHELRTPLNAVLGYTDLLETGALSTERSVHALAAIRRNARAQARLVESLLDLSRVIAGKLELDRERLDLTTVAHAALDAIRPEADRKDIAVEVDLPAAGVAIVADGGRLQQVLLNLLSNAVKFTPNHGRIALRVREIDAHAQIVVEDTGRGIAPDFLPFVFDRFRQSHGDGGGASGGLGLGLALVQEMVHAHGGSVVAESGGVGRGSRFTVTLPVRT